MPAKITIIHNQENDSFHLEAEELNDSQEKVFNSRAIQILLLSGWFTPEQVLELRAEHLPLFESANFRELIDTQILSFEKIKQLTDIQLEYLNTDTFIKLLHKKIIDATTFSNLTPIQLRHLFMLFNLMNKGLKLDYIFTLSERRGYIFQTCYDLFYAGIIDLNLIKSMTLSQAKKLEILSKTLLAKIISSEQALQLCKFNKKSLIILAKFILQNNLFIDDAILLANNPEACEAINDAVNIKTDLINTPRKTKRTYSNIQNIELQVEQLITKFLATLKQPDKIIEPSLATEPNIMIEEVSLASLIETVYNTQFIKFDVGSPVTYTAAADLIEKVDQVLIGIRDKKGLDKLDQKSKEKMAIIELTAIHYHLYTTQNEDLITPKLRDCKKLFTSLGVNQPEINAWLDLLQTYVVCILQKQSLQDFKIRTKIDQLTNITLDKKSAISQYKLQEIISTFYSILGSSIEERDVSLAIKDHSKALEIRLNNDRKQGVLSIYPGVTAMNLGAIHLKLGEYEKSREYLTLSLNIYDNYRNASLLPIYKISTLATLYFYLGEISKKLFQNYEAITYYKKALEIEKQFYGSDSNSQEFLRKKISECQSGQFFSVPESAFSKEPNRDASHLTITLEKYTAQPNAAKDSSNEKVLETLSNRSPR